MRSTHLEKILGRLEDLDSASLATLVQRLARERNLLETVFNIIREGVLVIDSRGQIGYANLAASRLIGLKEQDTGRAVLWKLVPELARSVLPEIRQYPENPAIACGAQPPVLSRELEITYPAHRYVRLYMVPFEAPEKDPAQPAAESRWHWAVIISDITGEKLSTREQIENEKLSSLFLLAAGVAHELGNPLNSMTIHLQLIGRQLEQLPECRATGRIASSLRVCTEEVTRLDGIIRNFLQAIRPTPPDLRETSLPGLVEEVLAFLEKEITNLGITVESHLPEELPAILGDPGQIRQVFFNLVRNALEAMDSGGQLEISARSDDDSVFVAFSDSGHGIDQQDLAQIFQPYFTTKKGGHGLGMMIVQRIMRDHGGTIGVESRPGEGTTILLQFPRHMRRLRMLEQQREEDQTNSADLPPQPS